MKTMKDVSDSSQPEEHAAIEIGDVAIDRQKLLLIGNGKRLHLAPRVADLLLLLAESEGIVVTREMIIDRLYVDQRKPEPKIVDVFICQLRKLLSEASQIVLIETVWGRGYELTISAD